MGQIRPKKINSGQQNGSKWVKKDQVRPKQIKSGQNGPNQVKIGQIRPNTKLKFP